MSERIVRMTVPIPLSTYRQIEASANRRGVRIGEFALQLIQARVTPTTKAAQITARRKAIRELLDLNYSQGEICARLSLTRDTVRHDTAVILREQAGA